MKFRNYILAFNKLNRQIIHIDITIQNKGN